MATAQPAEGPQRRLPGQYDVPPVPSDVLDAASPPGFTPVVDEGLSDSDSELLYRVSESIDRYEPIRASGSRIQVTLRQGSVVLQGRVRSHPLQVMAERLGEAAAAGRPFVSELIADPTVLMDVATALALDPRTNLAPVYVDCSLGVVRLQGPAPGATMVEAAAEVARGVMGVVEVQNELVEVAPPPPPKVTAPPATAEAAAKPTAAARPEAGAARPAPAAKAQPDAAAKPATDGAPAAAKPATDAAPPAAKPAADAAPAAVDPPSPAADA